MRDNPEKDQPLIGADEELYSILSAYPPSSIYLAVIKTIKKKINAADVLILERILLYSIAGETVLIPVLADLLRTTQEHILSLIDLLETVDLIQTECVYITKDNGILAHILGTKTLVHKLVSCRDQMRIDRRKSIEQRLTSDELAAINEDKREALQQQRWTLAESIKAEAGTRPQDNSKAAIGERARRWARAQRAVQESKRLALQDQRKELAKRVRVDEKNGYYVYYKNEKHRFPTVDSAVDALIEHQAAKMVAK